MNYIETIICAAIGAITTVGVISAAVAVYKVLEPLTTFSIF